MIRGCRYLDVMTQLTSEQLTLERLENAYKISAKLVALYGDIFLPFFERFHDEMALFKKREYTRSIAIDISQQYGK